MRRGIVSVMIVVGSLAWAAPAVAGPQPIALARGGDLYAFRLDRGMWRPGRRTIEASHSSRGAAGSSRSISERGSAAGSFGWMSGTTG
jgi:hypothetical protein